jgi:DNA phosphorothioation-dependent restriction protein DptH
MHSTSSQLYKYIGKLIIQYFKEQRIAPGDRYNVYLENNRHVQGLYNVLKTFDGINTEDFNYLHPQGGESAYSTYCLSISETKVIIASSENASEDYFTMLRNQVAEQNDVFDGKAILILFSGKLDSLIGGSGSLIKEGMPLHHYSFWKKLEEEINSSTQFKPFEKEILIEALKRKTQSVVEDNNSIFDYEQIIECVISQNIKQEDYNKLGLFPHNELNSIVKKDDRQKIIRVNFDRYAEFENVHLHGNPDSYFERKVTDAGRQALRSEDWGTNDFAKVSRWIEDREKVSPPEIKDITLTSGEVFQKIWWKSDGTSPNAKRSNSIIIFNPNKEYPYELEFKFDKATQTAGILSKSDKLSVLSSGHSLKVNVTQFKETEIHSLVSYRDKDSEKLYHFRILELPWDSNVLKNFETNFQINKDNQLLIEESPHLIFNPDMELESEDILNPQQDYPFDSRHQLDLKIDYESINGDELIPFSISTNGVSLNLAIKPDIEPPRIITGIDVWKEKREQGLDFSYSYEEEVLKLKFKNNERTVRSEYRKNLLLEKQIIESDGLSWIEKSENDLVIKEIELHTNLIKTFNELRNYYRENNKLPSLTILKGNLKILAENYVRAFNELLKNLQPNKSLNSQERDLIHVGVIKQKFGEGLIKFTPLHPLNVAYQLYLNDRLDNEEIYDAILKRLNPKNLVPFLRGDLNKIYTPIDSDDSPEWLYYTEYLESEQSVPKSFVTKLITSKIETFTQNFDFLFSQSTHSPIKLNVINLGDCREVVQGLFEYYRSYLNRNKTKRPQNLVSIDVNIYGSDHLVTKFEELTYYDHAVEVENKLGIKLETSNFEKEDLLNSFLEKVNFYSKPFPKEKEPYEYAHITFYQFDRRKTQPLAIKVKEIKSGLSLNGLMADVPSVPNVDSYWSGFGTKHMYPQRTDLTNLVCMYNALVNVATNGAPYENDKAICTSINYSVKKDLENLYINSQWVTYIDPRVDLDFFKENDDLVIIHYSDQYNNSSSYDAITVSNKTKQYSDIVHEFLEKNNVEHNGDEDTLKVINFFNAINGDWLLKLIRQDSQFPREKISLLSGIKLSLAFLYHPNIIWVPVSLEEILRISGSAGLKQSEGLFSARNLGSNEFSFSDDILMIGLEQCDIKLRMHLYPMELKIGGSNLVSKGIVQGRKTATLLRNHVLKEGFLGEFYRNFFGKLAITNAEKMKLYGIWENQEWSKIYDDYRCDLMNNQFEVSTSLEGVYGNFGLIHFGTNTLGRKLKKSEDHVIAELWEADGYNFLVKSIDELINIFHKTESIDRKELLINRTPKGTCQLAENEIEFIAVLEELAPAEHEVEGFDEESFDDDPIELIETQSNQTEKMINSGEGIEVLFGTNLKNHHKVIWEPNNTDKVMHTNTGIIGTMGTGKTQFTKSLIYQLIKNSNKNIGNDPFGILIFDYKGDYIKDDFVNATEAKVYNPFHLPYNPLALDATPKSKPMLPLHTANDIKETISNAFNLGNVQKQKLRDVIVEAYEVKGIYKDKRETWALPAPTIGDVCNIYMSDENIAQDSLYAAISNLQDFEIFEPNTSKTKSLYSLIEGVTVINLSGYDESIQNLIVAITLDAFYTQMQVNGHSEIQRNMRQIRKMILVDEADNFLSKNFSSIKKILKEGREFGVGTILSTQFLNHFSTGENDYSNYILTWVIHRVNEIKTKEVESLFTIESKDQRDNLMKTIKGLEKHQSIVNLAGSEPLLIKDKAFWELIN